MLSNLITNQYLNEKVMKQIEIQVPAGCEIDRENSTFERIIFKEKKVKNPTWHEIQVGNIRKGVIQYLVSEYGTVMSSPLGAAHIADVLQSHVPDRRTAERIRALCQLHVIAEYYNEGWKPRTGDNAYRLYYCATKQALSFTLVYVQDTPVPYPYAPYFKDEATAKRAYEANKEIFDALLMP